MFTDRVSQKFGDAIPHVEFEKDNVPVWVTNEWRDSMRMTTCGPVGRPMSEWSLAPLKYAEFRPGVYDVNARIKDMDLNGVWASQNFPSFLFGFAGRRLSLMKDQELAVACVRAYNDWMITDWCGAYPERLIPCQLPLLHDPIMAANEIRLNATRGFKSVSFSENPEALGLPNIYTNHWDPFFSACEETDTVINLHVGSSGQVQRPCSSSPIDVGVALFPIGAILGLIGWIYSSAKNRYV